jgi:phosphopantothenoylcysteine synthetase/decarboxylase
LRVLVTSGGTREPIDDVRVLANTSTGRLGARLVEALQAAGHQVTLLHGALAASPGVPADDAHVFDTSEQLAALLRRHAPQAQAVFHAAAVSDYLPERQAGKLSSDEQTYVLHLRRAPKLVDELRGLAPDAFLVGFKLTSGADESQRVARAQQLLKRADLDLVVVNDTRALGPDDHQALLVEAGGVRRRVAGKQAVAQALAEALDTHPVARS